MFLAFPLIVPFCRFTFFLLKEKESKIKESMKIMGLTEMAYWASWLFHYFLYFTLISLLDTLIITTILTDSSFLFIWFWLWIYCMTFFAKAVLISSIFTKAKIGIMVAIGIFFIELVIHDIFYFNKDNFDATFQFWAASMPIIGISFSGDNILALEAAGEGMNFIKMGWEYKRFKVSSMIFWCAVNAVV
jgi:ATP-binding cassette subfamily A (ABC1) protein 3